MNATILKCEQTILILISGKSAKYLWALIHLMLAGWI